MEQNGNGDHEVRPMTDVPWRDWIKAVAIVFLFIGVLLAVAYKAYSAEGYYKTVRVVDGDTIWVRGDKGSILRVRLIGYDSPELCQKERPMTFPGGAFTGHAWSAFMRACRLASEAKGYLRALVEGKEVRLVSGLPETADKDKYGRLLRFVWLDGIDVSALMITLGYGKVMMPGRMAAEYWGLERSARDGKLGAWE